MKVMLKEDPLNTYTIECDKDKIVVTGIRKTMQDIREENEIEIQKSRDIFRKLG